MSEKCHNPTFRAKIRVLVMNRSAFREGVRMPVHLIRTFVGNVQDGAACLAMHRIAVMALQTADRTWKSLR